MLRVLITAVLLVLLAPTQPVVAVPPPWAVESPAAAGDGAFFGLGLDTFFENQKSLRIASQQSVTVLQQPDGSRVPMVVDGDPELLNRKFDLEWELRGAGVRVPLALSCFKLTDLIRVFPTLTFEAATADISLDILDKPEPSFSTSLQGRSPLFGTEIGVTANLGGAGFTGTSYRYRYLPSLKVDRSPGFAEPGFEVLHDEVRLSQEIHEVSTKVGYLSADRRTAYYTGVRARRTDVEIEDELRLRSLGYGQRTDLRSRSKLESEVVEALVGVDRQLGRSTFARTEASFGDQDYGVMVSVVYTGPNKPKEPPIETPLVVVPTLKLFWNLASLQLRNPSESTRLLNTDPWDPARTLDSLGVGFKEYQKQLAKAGVLARVLFIRHGTDPVEEARRRNLSVAPWLPQAPPALLAGPEVDTLIIFQPLTSARGGPTLPSATARIASTAGLARLALAESSTDDQEWVNLEVYKVAPPKWGPSVLFQHTRCVHPSATNLRVSLTYAGGSTDHQDQELEKLKASRKPCPAPHEHLQSVIVQQRARGKAQSVIIASSFFQSNEAASPLIARWIPTQ